MYLTLLPTAHTAAQAVLKAISSAGTSLSNLRLRTDNGPQYGSREFKKSMAGLGILHEFIWRHTSEQNRHVEPFHGTLKREHIWPHEFIRFQDAEVIMRKPLKITTMTESTQHLGISRQMNSHTRWRVRINESNHSENHAENGTKTRGPDHCRN